MTLKKNISSGNKSRIYVPSNSVNAYRNAPGWKEFADKSVGN